MKLKFWGTRGSVASGLTSRDLQERIKRVLIKASPEDIKDEGSIDKFIDSLPYIDKKTVGSNTACIQVMFGETFLIFDAGSGLRCLGQELIQKYGSELDKHLHIFLSHFHWDHIQGFPFFRPAFVKGNKITFYSAIENAYQLLSMQQEASFFPVKFEDFGADIDFITIDREKTFTVDKVTIDVLELSHPGTSTGYRVSDGKKSFVYMTDTEVLSLDKDVVKNYREFIKDADAIIVDSQYDFEESHKKKHWGHSSPFLFIDILKGTNVKRAFLFHHDPSYNDKEIYRIHQRACRYKEHNYPEETFEVVLAVEGDEYNF